MAALVSPYGRLINPPTAEAHFTESATIIQHCGFIWSSHSIPSCGKQSETCSVYQEPPSAEGGLFFNQINLSLSLVQPSPRGPQSNQVSWPTSLTTHSPEFPLVLVKTKHKTRLACDPGLGFTPILDCSSVALAPYRGHTGNRNL